MDFYTAFSLLLAVGFLVAGFQRQRFVDHAAYRKALALFLAALILYYPVSALCTVGVYLSLVARPAGFVLGVCSFRRLCLALVAANGESKGDGTANP
jgi:hypothetical protein